MEDYPQLEDLVANGTKITANPLFIRLLSVGGVGGVGGTVLLPSDRCRTHSQFLLILPTLPTPPTPTPGKAFSFS
ncbi:MAG: hypothetical protein V7L06_23170 [Nostoc sp.]